MKTIKRLSAVLIAVLLCAMILAPATAFAENAGVTYTPIGITANTVHFYKYLTMKDTANVPNATFSFTVTPGTAIAATTTTVAVIPGPTYTDESANKTYPSIADVTFGPSNSTTAGLPNDTAGNTTSASKYATQQATVDFTGVTFPEPGVYRYIVTENTATPEQTAAGIANDSTPARTLDVYVTNSDAPNAPAGNLEVAAVVLRSSGVGAPSRSDTYGTGDTTLTDKSASYTNSYTSYDLTISKAVSGNQASKDKYFKVTVVLTASAGTTYTVDLSDAQSSPTATAATTYSSMSNPNTITVPEGETSVSTDFYLKDTQSVKIQGIGPDVTYLVSEAAEDYKPSYVIDTGEAVNAAEMTTAQIMGSSDHTVAFTNTRAGTVPTGVMLTVVPGVAIVAIALFGLLTLKRKKNDA